MNVHGAQRIITIWMLRYHYNNNGAVKNIYFGNILSAIGITEEPTPPMKAYHQWLTDNSIMFR